jgi:hypothetical protein
MYNMRRIAAPRFKGYYCWRTWYIEECEEHGLFGMSQRHLWWLKLTCRRGLHFYLEDAPYHRHVHPGLHRLCGPYEVITAPRTLTDEGICEVSDSGVAIVFRLANPESGPWRDGNRRRRWEDKEVVHQQDASKYDYFPFRFAIRRANGFQPELVGHGPECASFCAA